jgi:hypothetical protein
MRILAGVTFALIGLVLQGCSSSDSPTAAQCPAGQHALSGGDCAYDALQVQIGPGDASANCPTFSPNPASAHTNQLIEWTNNTSTSLTVYQFEGFNNGVPPVPLTTVNPGETSGGVFYSSAGSISVYAGGCGDISEGTLIITVN